MAEEVKTMGELKIVLTTQLATIR